MWVMNQDKNECARCSVMLVDGNQVIVGMGDESGVVFGKYKSEEIAREVLRLFMLSVQNDEKVFRMPKEIRT